MNENHFISIGIFIEISRNDFWAYRPIVQSLFTNIAATQKIIFRFKSNPFSNNDFMFLPMAILGSTEYDFVISFTCVVYEHDDIGISSETPPRSKELFIIQTPFGFQIACVF
jgi:hypothetical protein